MNVIEASALGKRYGSTWALRECTLAIPGGHVAALVGPNGAGKTTLLNLAVGLTDPTAGTVAVLGGRRAGSPAALDGIAFVAQDAPLYKNLSVADMLHLARNLNRHFDQGYAEARLAELGVPLKRKAGKLSSHVLAELERVADYLILVSRGRVQVTGEVDDLLARHRVLTGPATGADKFTERLGVVHAWRGGAQAHLLIRTNRTTYPVPPGWAAHPVSLEELALAYLREPGAAALPGPGGGRALPLETGEPSEVTQ